MYKVTSAFVDLQDDKHLYNIGDSFPREGKVVTNDRLDELASGKNATGKPLIQLVEDVVQVVEEPVIVEAVAEEPKKRGRKKKNAD